MHEDGTEHAWIPLLVMEQGELLLATLGCPGCGLTTYELLLDQIHARSSSSQGGPVQDADTDSGTTPASSDAGSADTSSPATTSSDGDVSDDAASLHASLYQRVAVQQMNLMFSGWAKKVDATT